MKNLWQDLLYGCRMLIKKPAVTVIAVLSLGLGIGANTIIFSLIETTLLRPLPFVDAGKLIVIWTVPLQNRTAQSRRAVPLSRQSQDHGETGKTELRHRSGLVCLAVLSGRAVGRLGRGIIPGVLQAIGQALIDLRGRDRQIVFQCQREDAITLAPSYAPRLTADDLMGLAAWEIAIRSLVDGQPLPPLTGTTMPLPPVTRDGAALAEASRQRLGHPRPLRPNRVIA